MLWKKGGTVPGNLLHESRFSGFFSQFLSSYIQFIGYKWRLSSEVLRSSSPVISM
jgi:hypothetical protein